PLPEPDFIQPPVNVPMSPQRPRLHFPQPDFQNWPNPFNDMKMFQPRGFQNDRRPFNTRAQRRSFGDRGRPMRERGRFFGRGFPSGNNRGFSPGNNRGFSPGNNRGFSPGNNRGFPTDNNRGFPPGNNRGFPPGNNRGFLPGNNRGFPPGNNRGFLPGNNRGFFQRGRGRADSQTLQQFPAADNIDSAVGNLIVIQPQRKDIEDKKDSHSVHLNNNDASKPKLLLPQDKYHTSSSTTAVQEVKPAEPTPPKPRDKFSRYNDNDSDSEEEEEDDWMDSLLADDDVKADKIAEGEAEPDTQAEDQQDSSEKDLEESSEVTFEVEIRKLEFSDNEEEENKPKHIESPFSPVRRSALSPKRRSPFSPVRRSALSPKRRSPLSPKRRSSLSPKRRSSLSPKRRSSLSPERRSPLYSTRRTPLSSERRPSLSPVRKSQLSPKQRSPHLQIRRSPFSLRRTPPLPQRSGSPRWRSPAQRPLSPQWKSGSPHKPHSPRQRSISPRRPNASRQASLSPKKHSSPLLSSAQRSPLPPRKRSRSPVRKQSSPSHTSSAHRRAGYFNLRGPNQERQRYQGRDFRASRHHDNTRFDQVRYNQSNRGKYSPSGSSVDRGNLAGHDGKYQPRIRDRQDRKNIELGQDNTGPERSSQQQDKQPLMKEIRVKESPLPQIDLDKLTPEERAKIEARRKKFSSSEVKIDPAKKVSLKSIKERTKKRKKSQQESSGTASESQNQESVENKSVKVNKHNIPRQEAESSSGVDDQKYALLEEDSENSDTGRNWKSEGSSKTKHGHKLQVPGRLHISLDDTSASAAKRERKNGSYSRHHKVRGFPERVREKLPYPRAAHFQHRNDFVSDDDASDETVGQNTLASSIVAKKPFKPDIPPEKLRIEVKVASKEKKSKKAKVKADFSQVYSVPAKRRRETDTKAVEEEPEVPIKKSKKKKKDKKSKHKLALSEPEEDADAADNTEDLEPEVEAAAPVPRLSVLERLGKKVPFQLPKEKEKRKKKKKKSHTDEEPTELDVKIQKIKEKNAAIARRQQEIEMDKKRYG
ncbi:unnamed protein product, partial [Candidula unifasciata]